MQYTIAIIVLIMVLMFLLGTICYAKGMNDGKRMGYARGRSFRPSDIK